MSTRNATVKHTHTMNPEDQTPQAPLQSPVEHGAADIDIGLGGDAARIAELGRWPENHAHQEERPVAHHRCDRASIGGASEFGELTLPYRP